MFLDAIVERVDDRVRRLLPVSDYLWAQAGSMPPVRSLKAALSQPSLGVIAECKQRSPSKGWLTDSYDPVAQAAGYESGGACAVSVLTEPEFFAGDLSHLQAVRHAISLPVLRKDFVRHPVQLLEARIHGADAALLIVRIVDDDELKRLYETARIIGLEVLVEVHSHDEAERALSLGPDIVGVNNRDLDSFETRLEFSEDMARFLPHDIIRVSESGISSIEDMSRVSDWGYSAVLIGEALMRGRGLLEEWAHANQR